MRTGEPTECWEEKDYGLAKFSIYKYVKTAKGWRYCSPAYSSNNKIKPHVVLVDGQWERVGSHQSAGSAKVNLRA